MLIDFKKYIYFKNAMKMLLQTLQVFFYLEIPLMYFVKMFLYFIEWQ